jgi:DNA-binding phage protein
MNNLSTGLQSVLADLAATARRRGLSDSAWARQAGLPKESLSRLRRRNDCDWATLERLSNALELRLVATPAPRQLSSDGHFPLGLTRNDEQRLYQLVRSEDLRPESWRAEGPPFFMAGLAVLLAGSSGQISREALLELAETLHPGILELAVYQRWLKRTPVEPSRFFAQLRGAAQ